MSGKARGAEDEGEVLTLMYGVPGLWITYVDASTLDVFLFLFPFFNTYFGLMLDRIPEEGREGNERDDELFRDHFRVFLFLCSSSLCFFCA